MRSTRSPRGTLPGLALAALFLAGQLSSFTHLLTVRHATCPEHGELTHVDETAPSLAPAVEEADASYRASPRPATVHGHDHCLLCATRREQGTPGPALGAIAVTQPGVPALRGERFPLTGTSLALLRLAPKSSPPA